MRKLSAVLAIGAMLTAACGSSTTKPHSPAVGSDNCGPAPSNFEFMVGPDIHLAQAPLPCMRMYRSVQDRPSQDPEMAVAVAISGGGYRAANFGLGVLLALEKLPMPSGQNVLSEVDYFSTVSGGGFPVGAYIASLLTARRQPFHIIQRVHDLCFTCRRLVRTCHNVAV